MRKEEKKREKDRKRNRRKKTPLAGAGRVPGGRRVWYGAAACAVALAVALPGALLRFYGERQVGQVQRADNAYFSRQLEAYTGELDLYRKLLLLTGRWKSEKILEAAGTVWLGEDSLEQSVLWELETGTAGAAESEGDPGAADSLAEQEAWRLRREDMVLAINRLRWALEWVGLEAETVLSSGEMAEYRVRDAYFGKYEFTVYLCSFSLEIRPLGSAAQGERCQFTLLLDAETQLALELDREGGEELFAPGGGEYWLWTYLSNLNQRYAESVENVEAEERPYQMPLYPSEEPAVQECCAGRQEDREGEVYAWVYQEEDGRARFYAGLPREE